MFATLRQRISKMEGELLLKPRRRLWDPNLKSHIGCLCPDKFIVKVDGETIKGGHNDSMVELTKFCMDLATQM
ncbi:hypothetical protein CR513_54528, partial [Mucuna pruriens]